MYNIGFPQPTSDGYPVILHKFDTTDALKARFFEFTYISAQWANRKEQRLTKVTFMNGRILILEAKTQK
ncbi:hypothetical protein ACVDHD_23390, partial [Enterobacter roggenkampii]